MMKKTVIHILAGLTLAMLLAGCAATRSGGEASAGGINPAESTTPRQASAASESADDAAADWTEAVGKGKIGFQMPDFSVPTVSGETFTLSQTLKERELVLINFWASWCGPCVHEFPFLQQAYEANQDRVDVIALSVEQGDSLEKLKQFSEENHVSFQIGQDENLRLAQCFNVTSIPTSLLVDRSGKVVWMQTGAMRSAEDVKRLFEQYLQKAGMEAGNGEVRYQIRVVDQAGNPVAGAVVNFCSDEACQPVSADEKGLCEYSTAPGEYHVQILSLPEGYEAETAEALTVGPEAESGTLSVRKLG